MSRTYRRRKDTKDDLRWLLSDYIIGENWTYRRISIDKDSDLGKRKLMEYHSEAYSNFCEPGPHWYRNITTERPQRREAKRQLNEFLKDPEFVVILNPKDKLEYWT